MSFSRHAEAAVPTVEGRKITVGLKMRSLPVVAFEKFPQLSVSFHHMAVGINDRIIHVHNHAPGEEITDYCGLSKNRHIIRSVIVGGVETAPTWCSDNTEAVPILQRISHACLA